MTTLARTAEAQKLSRLRATLGALSGAEWTLAADGEGMAVMGMDAGGGGDMTVIARIDPRATPDEIEVLAGALDHQRFLLALVDRAIATQRPPAGARGGRQEPQPPKGKNYAAEAAIACGKPAFRVFLGARHGLRRPLTDERVAQKLRSLLGVTSRRDLNDDAAAAERWKALRGEFEAWRRAGR